MSFLVAFPNENAQLRSCVPDPPKPSYDHRVVSLLLAHQGGWDEMLLVAVPIALFGGLLWMANRRAEARLREEADQRRAEQDHADTPDIPAE